MTRRALFTHLAALAVGAAVVSARSADDGTEEVAAACVPAEIPPGWYLDSPDGVPEFRWRVRP